MSVDERRLGSVYPRRRRRPCHRSYGGEATNSNIAAGATVTKTIGEYGPRIRPGTVRGTVSLQQALGPGGIEGPGGVSVPVGSFAIRVP
jgi:hypothetical protein